MNTILDRDSSSGDNIEEALVFAIIEDLDMELAYAILWLYSYFLDIFPILVEEIEWAVPRSLYFDGSLCPRHCHTCGFTYYRRFFNTVIATWIDWHPWMTMPHAMREIHGVLGDFPDEDPSGGSLLQIVISPTFPKLLGSDLKTCISCSVCVESISVFPWFKKKRPLRTNRTMCMVAGILAKVIGYVDEQDPSLTMKHDANKEFFEHVAVSCMEGKSSEFLILGPECFLQSWKVKLCAFWNQSLIYLLNLFFPFL
ncbi:Serine acetyltransferase 4 [Camellia lanceoleosa]|uniref:Serine acetyltransferase 4 n=1 Tax=Camellia lanceoleosa TaxID=1840588 RepID=A0ACC0IAM7_9ERIC|nr:Serine acetyltransferase 4 [Camellia lanceoleosa]